MPGPALFLGLELATDQLRASIVDESLDLLGVESIDFDTELPEFQTHGGIFTTPADAYHSPVAMWVQALDLLLEKLRRNYDLSRIRSIGGSAQHALVWWAAPQTIFESLDPRVSLAAVLPQTVFSLPNTPNASDSSAQTHASAIEAALGGHEAMSRRVGISSNPGMIAAQLLRVRQTRGADVWARTEKVQLASSWLASLFTAKWVGMGEAEACASGMWVHGHEGGHWDEGVLDVVGGNDGGRLKRWLGDVDCSGGARRAGAISKYLVDRYGFDADAIVTPFTSDVLATYLSLCPSASDAVMSFGPTDTLLTPAATYIAPNPTHQYQQQQYQRGVEQYRLTPPPKGYSVVPHPAQGDGERRRYIAVLSSRNGDVPRALVRDMYTKSWSAFDRLVDIVPPGGSIGLDDKLFSFWYLQGDTFPFSHVKGIFRFETGIKVNEFRDLRANPRCLLESQLMAFRVKWSRMVGTGILGTRGGRSTQQGTLPGRSSIITSSLGLSFDPYDPSTLPMRILATGAAANFPTIASLLGDVFNAPVFIPNTQLESAAVSPHRNTPAAGFSSRAALGGAYVARWVWGKERGGAGVGGYEDEIKRLLRGRKGASVTPAFRRVASSGNLKSEVLVEEDEDEVEFDDSRHRTVTSSTSTLSNGSSLGIGGPALSSAFTTPDLANPTPTTTSALTPVAAMLTGDAETQVGLVKVAEPDLDAFMSFAALVPEFCRLEGLVVKGIV